MHTIVKVQRPLAFSHSSKLLVYNEDRSIDFDVPFTDNLQFLFEEGEYKAFYYAQIEQVGPRDLVTFERRATPEEEF